MDARDNPSWSGGGQSESIRRCIREIASLGSGRSCQNRGGSSRLIGSRGRGSGCRLARWPPFVRGSAGTETDDEPFEDHRALRPLFRCEPRDDEVSILHPDARVAAQQGIDPLQERFQLGLMLRQAGRALVGGLELLAHLAAQGGPTIPEDQVRLRVGVAAAGFQPDVTGPQGRAQLREHAELEVAPVDPPLIVDHVGAPLRRDEIDGGAPGQVPALPLTPPPEQAHGLQERVGVDARAERERREERRDELAEVTVPLAKEVEGTVLVGADDPGGFLDDFLEPFGGDPPIDGVSELGIADRGVEPGPGPLADEIPLELGQGGKDMEDQLAAAGGRVDALPEAPGSDPALPESGDRLDEVSE
jgi:hypothetical protein